MIYVRRRACWTLDVGCTALNYTAPLFIPLHCAAPFGAAQPLVRCPVHACAVAPLLANQLPCPDEGPSAACLVRRGPRYRCKVRPAMGQSRLVARLPLADARCWCLAWINPSSGWPISDHSPESQAPGSSTPTGLSTARDVLWGLSAPWTIPLPQKPKVQCPSQVAPAVVVARFGLSNPFPDTKPLLLLLSSSPWRHPFAFYCCPTTLCFSALPTGSSFF